MNQSLNLLTDCLDSVIKSINQSINQYTEWMTTYSKIQQTNNLDKIKLSEFW